MKPLIRSSKTAQRGVVLFITLVVLVALALAALAMFRGSMGATMVASNVVYKQAALNLADNGVQLGAGVVQTRAVAGQITNDDQSNGFFSSVPATEPNWADPAFWSCGTDTVCPSSSLLCGNDAACMAKLSGLTVKYKVHRMCTMSNQAFNTVTNSCALTVKTGGAATGGSLGVGATQFTGNPMIYFRITTRVDGPRNTQTITQTVVALQT